MSEKKNSARKPVNFRERCCRVSERERRGPPGRKLLVVFSRGRRASDGGDEDAVEVKREKRGEADETLEGTESSFQTKRAK